MGYLKCFEKWSEILQSILEIKQTCVLFIGTKNEFGQHSFYDKKGGVESLMGQRYRHAVRHVTILSALRQGVNAFYDFFHVENVSKSQ